MTKATRVAVAAAAGALALAVTGSALAAFNPKLVVSGPPTSNAGGAVNILTEVAASDDPTARVVIYIPSGYQIGTPAGGAKLGSVKAQAQAVDLGGATLPLEGDLLAASSATQFAAQQTACLGAVTPGQTWYLHLTAAGQTLDIPMFLVEATTAEKAFASWKLVVCLPPPDVPVGTPGRATFGAKLLSASFSNTAIVNPPAAGEYRWRSLWTPYTPALGQVNALGSVETQSLVRLPTQITQKVAKKKVFVTVKGKKQARWAVTVGGTLTAGGTALPARSVTITTGPTKTKRARLATVPTNANGVFRKTSIVKSPQWFQSSTTLAAQSLGAAGCTATFAPVPCISASVGSYRLVSGWAKV